MLLPLATPSPVEKAGAVDASTCDRPFTLLPSLTLEDAPPGRVIVLLIAMEPEIATCEPCFGALPPPPPDEEPPGSEEPLALAELAELAAVQSAAALAMAAALDCPVAIASC